MKILFASIPFQLLVQCCSTFCKCYRRQRIFPFKRDYIKLALKPKNPPHLKEELALSEDLSNAVSKKCKHGVKTLVDTIVDQPCQYGNVVIMSYGGHYDAYPMW